VHEPTVIDARDAPIDRCDVLIEIKTMLAECLECAVDDIPDDLSFDDPSVRIDSLSLIRLSAAIDERFDLWVPDGSKPDDPVFRSVTDLTEWIAAQLEARRNGRAH
jgi:acyl carrier protein